MQKSGLSRRDFLRLMSLAPLGIYSRQLTQLAKAASNSPNIIIIVFDAWSARNVSLYGYPRPTMPHLEQFAEKATVYHNHYSAGTFTVPGTSSLLTGMHPWTHRAFQIGGFIADAQAEKNIFSALASTHSTLAYTQNEYADRMLYQIEPDLDRHVENWAFNAENTSLYGSPFFKKDIKAALGSLADNIVQEGEGFDSSLFFGPLYRLHVLSNSERVTKRYGDRYPHGVPLSNELFLMNDVVDGAMRLLKEFQQPMLSYLHFFPPHEPYTPTSDFFDKFKDGWNPPDKPVHPLSERKIKPEKTHIFRQHYDEYIASWDEEVARLFQFLEQSGLRENSYIFITSDHGELLERGEVGHSAYAIYDGLVHVPLIVSRPGQTEREDVHTITSSVDLVPTIAHLTGNPIPAWGEGKLLPSLGGETDERRSIFSMDAKTNSSFGPLKHFVMALTRDQHRIMYCVYPRIHYEKYEFYDLDADPEEVNDLYSENPSLAVEMQDELMQKISEVNRPYRQKS